MIKQPKKGDRVISNADPSTGTVFRVDKNLLHIKRDDKKQGTGCSIPGYGRGWLEYSWGVRVIKDRWKDRVENG